MHATQNTAVRAVNASRRWDNAPEADFDRRFFDLRDAGYDGPIDQDGHPALTFNPDKIPADTTATTLRCAARYLSRHGWTQHTFYEFTDRASDVLTPRVCAGGAIAIVSFGWPVDNPECNPEELREIEARRAAEQYLSAVDYLDDYLIEHNGMCSFTFNDVQGRTAIQVIAVLLRAADEWDNTFGGAA
jgi:hypothetical protein